MTPRTTSPRRARALGTSLALLTGAAVAIAAPLSASAHVRVDPAQAEPGAYTTLTFKVPNESATAGTTSLTVDLPTDTPFTSVSYQPVPGWTASVERATLPEPITVGDATITEAPVSVTWTATDGVGIGDGQFQLFPLSVGPVPDTGSIALPAHQGYSDGSVVDWDEPATADGTEPEHPAPVLFVTDAPAEDDHAAMAADGSGAGDSGASGEADADGVTASSSGSDVAGPLGLGFGIGGFVLGAAALVLAAVAFTRRRPVTSGSGR
jgi:uncharacterized protein YcnI